MADDTARAVGSKGRAVVINGKECQVRALALAELGEIERACLRFYRQDQFQSIQELIAPGEDREKLIREEREKLMAMTVSDLPPRFVYDPATVVITSKLRKHIHELFRVPTGGKKKGDKENLRDRRLVVTALESSQLSEDEYAELAGQAIERVPTAYVNWWTSGSLEGLLEMLWQCFKTQGITRDELSEAFGSDPSAMIDIARDVEHSTVPDSGNG